MFVRSSFTTALDTKAPIHPSIHPEREREKGNLTAFNRISGMQMSFPGDAEITTPLLC
jgi:hypothetical protein